MICMRSHVMYLYTGFNTVWCIVLWSNCRHIHTHISEHVGILPLSGERRSVSTMSSILAHTHFTKYQIFASFKILSTGTSETDLLTRD